jgi:hypothetical protein
VERGAPPRRYLHLAAAIATTMLLGCDTTPRPTALPASVNEASSTPTEAQAPRPTEPPISVYTALDVEGSEVCALATSGEVRCWGTNDYGETVTPAGSFGGLALAESFGCAIGADQMLVCWGEIGEPPTGKFSRISAGSTGPCGITLTGRVECPGYVEAGLDRDAGYREIAAGATGACAIRLDERVACWTDFGEAASPAPSVRFRAISAGVGVNCGIRLDDTLACWSAHKTERLRRHMRPPSGSYKAVSVGLETACAIRTDETLACWGLNATYDKEGARLVPSGRYLAVSAGFPGACAIRIDRRLICWGGDFAGRAVPDDLVAVMPEVASTPTTPVIDVSRNFTTTCAIRKDGSLGCWGSDIGPTPTGAFRRVEIGFDQVCGIRGDGSIECWPTTIYDAPALAPPSGTFTDLDIGDMLCGIRTDGTLACVGPGADPVQVPPGMFLDVSVGVSACGLRDDANIVCWFPEAPVENPPTGPFAGVSHSYTPCGIRPDGSVECWGDDAEQPAGPVSGTYSDIEGACGLRTDGTLACWGIADYDSEGNPILEPAPPSGTYTALDDHCAIRTEGTVVCWGSGGLAAALPTAYVLPPESWVATDDVTFAWGGSGLAPAVAFDVDASWMGQGGSTRWLTRTTDTSATVPGSPGTSYCISVRAHDNDGFVSRLAHGDCVHAPYDDVILDGDSAWRRVSGPAYYGSGALKSTSRGATVKLRLAPMRLALLVTTCPTCGEIRVSGLGAGRRTIDLRSATTEHRKLIELELCDGCEDEPIPTTLTIEITSSGRPVIIDGLAMAGFLPD